MKLDFINKISLLLAATMVIGCTDDSFIGDTKKSKSSETATATENGAAEPETEVETTQDTVQPGATEAIDAENEVDNQLSCIVNDRATPGLTRDLDEVAGTLTVTGSPDDNLLEVFSRSEQGHVDVDDGSNLPITYSCLNRILFRGSFGDDRLLVQFQGTAFRALTSSFFQIFIDGEVGEDVLSVILSEGLSNGIRQVTDTDGFETRIDAQNLGR